MVLVTWVGSCWVTNYSSCSLFPILRSNLGLRGGELGGGVFPQNALSFFSPASIQHPSSPVCQCLLSMNFHCVDTQAEMAITEILPDPCCPLSSEDPSSESVVSFSGSNEWRCHQQRKDAKERWTWDGCLYSSRRLHALPIGGILGNVYGLTQCKYTSWRATRLCQEEVPWVTEEVPVNSDYF